MTALNKQALRYGDNVLWFLNELAAYDASDIDGGEFDVYGEDRNGLEGCSTIDVTELAADAAKLIEAAEKRIAELEARDINIKRQAQALFEAIANPNDCYIPAYVRCLREALNGNSTGIGVKGERDVSTNSTF
ncbi:hypothetical protein CKC86_03425 [Salmonella enterica]|nr:hypothetical protein [Salmonella enterica]EIT0299277.1 hypothetical protein [Salmonella enterica]